MGDYRVEARAERLFAAGNRAAVQLVDAEEPVGGAVLVGVGLPFDVVQAMREPAESIGGEYREQVATFALEPGRRPHLIYTLDWHTGGVRVSAQGSRLATPEDVERNGGVRVTPPTRVLTPEEFDAEVSHG